jgi:aryl-alcohol dehydrogenase-like predicted oxidoreductase
MGLTGVYNAPVPEDAGVAVIRRAFEAGVTFFDTADAYGPHTNEVLLGKVRMFLLLPNSDAVFVSHSVGMVKL